MSRAGPAFDPAFDAAFEASWPAVEYAMAGPFRLGRGQGGGRRVSSARLIAPDWTEADIDQAIDIQQGWNQPPAFRLAEGRDAAGDRLADSLRSRGLRREAPTLVMAAPLDRLTDQPVPRVTSFAIWPPLAIQRELWTEAGIGPARQAIMDRVCLPKAALLGRIEDRAAGVAFVAADGALAILHALEITPGLRRKGLAGWMLREAAFWAQAQGSGTICLAVTAENASAIALYRKLGFAEIGGYSYYLR